MLSLAVKIRKDFGKKVKALRQKGVLPGVLYGAKIKNQSIEVDLKEFEKIYQEAGENTLISLEVEGKKNLVLIYSVKKDPLDGNPIHADFYQPSLEKEIEAKVPIVFEDEAPAVKNLGGTFIKNIPEIEVRALPQNLPHEIKISIKKLETFNDSILIKDLVVPKEVKVLRNPEDIIASVSPPEKVEEELEKPIEEKVEEVEKVEKKEKVVEETRGEKPAESKNIQTEKK